MKKYFSIFMVAMLLIMASCSESDSPAMADMRSSDNIVNTDDAVPYDQSELAAVFAALDSLNATVPNNVSRGFFRRFGVNIADLVGGAIGADLGGPLGMVLGYSAASAFMEERYERELAENAPGSGACYAFVYDDAIRPSEMCNIDGTIAPIVPVGSLPPLLPGIGRSSVPDLGDNNVDLILENGLNIDRIGYQHNYAMYEITRNMSMYNFSGVLDTDMLFYDITMFMNCEEVDGSTKTTLKNCALEIADLGFECYDAGYSDDSLIWIYADYLTNAGLSRDDLAIFIEFTAEIALRCQNFSADEIHAYAVELNSMLKNQTISTELKVKLAIIAQCAVNSALFWQQ